MSNCYELDAEKSEDDRIVVLEKKISELNNEFGVKRAKYKELFLKKEGLFICFIGNRLFFRSSIPIIILILLTLIL